MIGDFLFLDDNLCLFCKDEEKEKFSLCKTCLSKLDYVDNEFEILNYKARVLYFYNPFMAHLRVIQPLLKWRLPQVFPWFPVKSGILFLQPPTAPAS